MKAATILFIAVPSIRTPSSQGIRTPTTCRTLLTAALERVLETE